MPFPFGVNSKLLTSRVQILNFPIEDLAADGDIAAKTLLAVPSGLAMELIEAGVIAHGASAGIDDDNTLEIALTDGTNELVAKVYNTATQPPDSGAYGSLGAVSAVYKELSAGSTLVLAVTGGTTANPPAMTLQLAFRLYEI